MTRSAGRAHRVLRRAALLMVSALLCACASVPKVTPTVAATQTPRPAYESDAMYRENLRPGSTAWRITNFADQGQIAGYASAVSIDRGGSLRLYVSTKVEGDTYDLKIFRLGYYQGTGARLLLTTPTLDGVAQGWWADAWYSSAAGATVQACPTCIFDHVDARGTHTHRVDANWRVTYTLQAPQSWLSGCYLVLLETAEGYQAYVPFVIRDDASRAALVMKLNVSTWEAYNTWGNYNLYATWKDGEKDRVNRAREVSFNRPYASGYGAGDLLTWEAYMVRFLEERSYDVTYTTSVDISRAPLLLGRHMGLVVAGHDEYWDVHERDAVEGAIRQGLGVAFFAGNESFFQARYGADDEGNAYRTVICYHDSPPSLEDPAAYAVSSAALDTTQWRLPPVSRPENAMIGLMYGGDFDRAVAFDFVVSDASSWIYRGTGLRDGDTISAVVGYEVDTVVHNSLSPPTLQVVAASPVRTSEGARITANAAIYVGPAGNIVFGAGSIDWVWALDEGVRYPAPLAGTPPSWQMVTITKNIVTRIASGSVSE